MLKIEQEKKKKKMSSHGRPMTNVILQSLWLDLVNINVSTKLDQNIPNGSRVIGIFRKLTGDKRLHNVTSDGHTERL